MMRVRTRSRVELRAEQSTTFKNVTRNSRALSYEQVHGS